MAIDVKRKLVFKGTFAIKKTLEDVLRALFSNNKIVQENYLYNTDDKLTKIKIFRSHPGRVEFYPCIIISAGSFDYSPQSFDMGSEVASERIENGTLVGTTNTGYAAVPINIKVFAKRADDRDVITDILLELLRVVGRSATHLIWWNKIRVSGDEQHQDRTEMVFTNTINILVHTDYTQIIQPDAAGLIEKIVTEVIPVVVFTPTE